MSAGEIRLKISGRAAEITIDRPAKKNAMSPDLHRSMAEALDQIEARGDVAVVTLTGVGDVFCGGMDLEKYFLEAWDTPVRFRENLATAHTWMRRWKDLDAITVAAVNGWCVGGGILIASLSDVVIAADEAEFSISEVNFGIFPAGGTTWGLARHMPAKQAMLHILTARPFFGPDAVRMGLASSSVPRGRLEAEVGRVVDALLTKDPAALRYAKKVYERVRVMDFPDAQEFEVAMLLDLSYSTDARWIRDALERFKARGYQPARESYLDEEAGD